MSKKYFLKKFKNNFSTNINVACNVKQEIHENEYWSKFQS